MKKFNSKWMVLLAAFSLAGVGCGDSNSFSTLSSDSSVVDSGVIVSPGETNSPSTGVYTNTATLVPVSFTEFNSYVALHALNNPTNIRVTVNLNAIEEGRYAGSVNIAYSDAGNNYSATFTAGSGRNVKYSSLNDNNHLEAEFNRWFTFGGSNVFSGYFQDKYGAIVLVIDNSVNEGDGQGGGYVSGSIYYKNFAQSYATQSPVRKCWHIYNGPYDCRSYAVSDKTALYPTDNGYRKLGTFTGLSKSASFK